MRHCVKRALCVLVSLSILFTLSSVFTLSTTASSETVTPSIAVGNNFIIVQTNKGELWGWGDNSGAVLGNPQSFETNQNVSTPTKIELPSGIHSVSMSAGFDHVLMLGSDGNVYAWGHNTSGQLGSPIGADFISAPTIVEGLRGKNIVAVAAGKQFSLALSRDGTVYSFGNNDLCQLGYEMAEDSEQFSATPIQIAIPTNVAIKQISVGYASAVAIDADGKAYLWGSTENCILGVTASNPVYKTPFEFKKAELTSPVFSVAMSQNHSAFLLGDDCIGFLGFNKYGQYGNTLATTEPSTVLKTVDISPLHVKSIAVSDSQTVLLSYTGKVYTAGARWQEAAESAANTFVPLFDQTEQAPTAVAIAAGYQNGAMLAQDGAIWVWGSNSNAQLGNGTQGDGQGTPTKVWRSDDLTYITAIKPFEKDVAITVKTSVPAPSYTVTIPSTVDVDELCQIDASSPSRYSWTQFYVETQNVENLFGEKAIRVWVEPGEGDTFCLQDDNGNTIPFELFPYRSATTPLLNGEILKEFTQSDRDEVWIRIDKSQISKTGIYSGILTFHYAVVDIPENGDTE